MDVIVIGCGASGLAAVRRLHDAGLKVAALEAGGRRGGRVHSVYFGEGVVDIGAAWCHGEQSNIVYELASPLDLLGRPSDADDDWYLLSKGALVPTEHVQSIIKTLKEGLDKTPKDGSSSILECVRKIADSNEDIRNSPLKDAVLEWYERANHLGGQDDPKRGKSLKGLEECWPCEGEFMLNWKGRGYTTILDVLLNRYPDPSKEITAEILLNKEVDSIRYGRSQPGEDSDHPLVHVSCKDGSLYSAKSVIVTVSIGVLKERHEQLFNPQLPPQKVSAINNLELCILDKIYVEFTEPWWPKSPAHFAIFWQEEDKKKYTKNKWITGIHGANTVEHQPNVLLFWLYGNSAKMMEEASQDEVEEGVEAVLEMFKTSFDVTPVKSVIRSQWASNPLIRGAYSYRCVSTEQNGGGALELSEPLYHRQEFPIVCFAGEATSHHRHNSVHGAIEAGFREADRLIEIFKK